MIKKLVVVLPVLFFLAVSIAVGSKALSANLAAASRIELETIRGGDDDCQICECANDREVLETSNAVMKYARSYGYSNMNTDGDCSPYGAPAEVQGANQILRTEYYAGTNVCSGATPRLVTVSGTSVSTAQVDWVRCGGCPGD